MVNKKIFSTGPHTRTRLTTHVNRAGGKAYKLEDAEALCQYAVTSTFSDVYYAKAEEQLDEVKRICKNVSPELIAKVAVYARERGKMKDTPAFLAAYLASIGEVGLLKKIFSRVMNNPKMLLNFVQMIRSGVTGRKSFGSAVKSLIQNWITSRWGNKLFLASIGYSNPSLADVIKMVHPCPANAEQSALFAYLLGAKVELDDTSALVLNRYMPNGTIKQHDYDNLPPLVREFEAFKADNTQPLPDLDYRALTNCDLTQAHWQEIALNMPWNTLRLNLNVLLRNGAFQSDEVVDKVANLLANKEEVKKWNAFPYQLMTAYMFVESDMPLKIKNALQMALNHSLQNVPVLGKKVGIAVDVSGSMSSPITGQRRESTSVIRCVDVASLITASLARTNPEALVVSFGSTARVVPNYNPWDSLVTNANKLVHEGDVVGHGTCALEAMNVFNHKGKFDFIVFVSDCQSWIETAMKRGYYLGSKGTGLMDAWEAQRVKNKKAKLAEINVQPYGDTQADSNRKDILNVGGFNDSVFDVLAEFAVRDENVRFVDIIEKTIQLE